MKHKKILLLGILSLTLLFACKSKDEPAEVETTSPIPQETATINENEVDGADVNYSFLTANEALSAFLDAMVKKDYDSAQKMVWPTSEKLAGYEPGTYVENFIKNYDVLDYDYTTTDRAEKYVSIPVNLLSNSQNGEYNAELNFTIIDDGNGYFICADNVIAAFEGESLNQNSNVGAYLKKVQVTPTGLTLDIQVSNNSDNTISFSQNEDDSYVTLITDYVIELPEGEEEYVEEELIEPIDTDQAGSPFENFIAPITIESGETKTIECQLLNTKGKIQAILLDNIVGIDDGVIDVDIPELTKIEGSLDTDFGVSKID